MKMKRNMRKYAALLLAALMMMASLSGYKAASGQETSASEAASGAVSESTEEAGSAAEADAAGSGENGNLRVLNVVLDWYPNALHTFLYTAIERGYYREEGLDVKINFPANDNDALSLVAAGQAEIGIYYEHDIIQVVANQNVGVKSIGAIVQSPLNVILSLREKNITKPEDLAGKTIGYSGTALSEAIIDCMMKDCGVDSSDVNMINVGFELMSSMTTGNVDATIGCLVNHEVPQMEEEGFEVNYFMAEGHGVPSYYEAVFLTNIQMLTEEADVLAGFLRASARGFVDFQEDPDTCLQILLSNQNEENFPLSPTVEQKSCQTLLPLMETDEAPFLSQSEEQWQTNIDWMYENGLIRDKVDVADVMTEIPR